MKCENCRYYEPHEKSIADYGECRKSHPVCITDEPSYENMNRAFPEIFPDDWCGEFKSKSHLSSIAVSDAGFSIRTRRCLMRLGIATMEELAITPESQLLGRKNFGETCLLEVRRKLVEFRERRDCE